MLHSLGHFLKHVSGTDSQSTWFYMFWSGIATQLSFFAGVVTVLRHRNCHVKGCWRLGHNDPEHHHPACRRHHSHAHKLG